VIEIIKENWIISIISTLVIGALGSGLWEVVFKPVFKKIGDVTFYILTVGIKKTRDDVYLDAAKNHREQGGVFIARHMALILASILIAFSMVTFQTSYGKIEYFNDFEKCNSIEIKQELKECKKEIAKEKLENLAIFTIPMFIFLAVVLMYTSLKIQQVYRITIDFNQYLTICRPHISIEEALSLEAEFALMKEKENYEKLIGRLDEIAKSNYKELPRYHT
jgi:hypothetical protein